MPTINFFNPIHRYDQPPIAMSASGFTYQPLWEAVNAAAEHAGKFEPRVAFTSTTLTPFNRTHAVTVRVFDAKGPGWTNISAPISMVGDELSYTLSGGTAGNFYGLTGTDVCAGGDCFVESRADGPMAARSVGLSTAPHNYAWNHSDYDYALALGQIGLGSIWINGISVVGAFSGVPGFTYQTGDVVRVGVESGKVVFRKNGSVLYQHTPGAPPTNLQPILSFYDFGGRITQTRFWQTSFGKTETTLNEWGVLPVCQDKLSEHETIEIAEVSEAEAQRGQDKVVRYHRSQDKWDLVFSGRRLSELQAMRDFRAFHRLHIPFYMADAARGIDKLVVFDTGIKDRLIQSNMFDFSCTVKEY